MLLRLLDVLGVERAHLVGNSMGGMISPVVAHRPAVPLRPRHPDGKWWRSHDPHLDLFAMVKYYDDPRRRRCSA